MNGIVFVYLKERLRSDLAEFAAAHPEVRVETRPWYSAFGWALLGIVVLLAMVLPPLLIISVVKVSSRTIQMPRLTRVSEG
jgi:L-cystine uptake protein TcyP (sodium:dicarboxylate symporter family)